MPCLKLTNDIFIQQNNEKQTLLSHLHYFFLACIFKHWLDQTIQDCVILQFARRWRHSPYFHGLRGAPINEASCGMEM